MTVDLTRGTRWAHEPHVRVGDPCYACGTPMVPASRHWPTWAVPPGYRRHGSLGLCQRCYADPALADLRAEARRG